MAERDTDRDPDSCEPPKDAAEMTGWVLKQAFQPPDAAEKPHGIEPEQVRDTRPEAFERREPGRGRAAEKPSDIPARGWRDILWRVLVAFFMDRVSFVAGGITFFTLLALFPAIAAFVSLYGLFNDLTSVSNHLSVLYGVLPTPVADFLSAEVTRIAMSRPRDLGVTFVFSLLVALWSSNASVKWLMYGLNVAYHETEKRNLLKYNLMASAFTVGALLFVMLITALVVAVPLAYSLIGYRPAFDLAFLRWPVLLAAYVVMLTLLYRWGPCRSRARWRWLSTGGIVAAVLNLAVSSVFSWWISNMADFQATYGSLGAVMGFMFWTWISTMIVLFGAELNAEMEHQTAVDTTTGEEKPMGERGALVADTVGPAGGGSGVVRAAGAVLKRRGKKASGGPPGSGGGAS
ncbi:MAG TPA: YihY/virulence factor BrkB family protein [Caulobacteraceae bacterium]|nr:YihY/virulence factor BrkB family protein [Caulobacteraceae bacterium]